MELGNSDNAIQRSALIFPADGGSVQLVSYSLKLKSEEDSTVDFYDYFPDLRPWLEPAFFERDFIDFEVDNTPSKEWFRSENPDNWGNYCLYYTTSIKLPINQTCKNVIKFDPPTERLFYRGDVILVKHKGSLGMGHEYIDTPLTMVDITMKIIGKTYENHYLEKKLEKDREFERELEKHKQLHPDLHLATETGAIERFRTGQMTEDDIPLIAALDKYRITFPDGSSRKLLG